MSEASLDSPISKLQRHVTEAMRPVISNCPQSNSTNWETCAENGIGAEKRAFEFVRVSALPVSFTDSPLPAIMHEHVTEDALTLHVTFLYMSQGHRLRLMTL